MRNLAEHPWKTPQTRFRPLVTAAIGVVHGVAALAIVFQPERASMVVLVALAMDAVPIVRGWRAAAGTALRPAVAWAGVALTLAATGMAVATREPIAGGRPGAGHLVYLADLAWLAALISVFNARRPGNGAWAILMGLLVIVFLIPWLEGIGLSSGGGGLSRLRLEAPWSWFFALLVLCGAGNYLPTRYAPAALVALAGLGSGLLGLTISGLAPAIRAALWTGSAWGLAAAVAVAGQLGGAADAGPDVAARRLWLTFRDHWGAVWALRVADRFNQAATRSGWGVRLGWSGPLRTTGDEPSPEEVAAVLQGLIRRFAEPAALGGRPSARDRG